MKALLSSLKVRGTGKVHDPECWSARDHFIKVAEAWAQSGKLGVILVNQPIAVYLDYRALERQIVRAAGISAAILAYVKGYLQEKLVKVARAIPLSWYQRFGAGFIIIVALYLCPEWWTRAAFNTVLFPGWWSGFS